MKQAPGSLNYSKFHIFCQFTIKTTYLIAKFIFLRTKNIFKKVVEPEEDVKVSLDAFFESLVFRNLSFAPKETLKKKGTCHFPEYSSSKRKKIKNSMQLILLHGRSSNLVFDLLR
jgi:hypothetical protein